MFPQLYERSIFKNILSRISHLLSKRIVISFFNYRNLHEVQHQYQLFCEELYMKKYHLLTVTSLPTITNLISLGSQHSSHQSLRINLVAPFLKV